jgi:hypothetical protein
MATLEETAAIAASAAASAAQAAAQAASATAQAANAATEAAKLGARAMEISLETRSEIREHVKVDEVLHAQILKNQDESKTERKEMHAANQDSSRRMYGLLWKVALGAIFGMASILATILLNR